MYGLVAKSVQISPDKLIYRFTLRPEARFHDGSKLTAHDVAFSLNTLKDKGHPLIALQTARHGEGRGARRRDAGRHLRGKARARRAALMSPACRSSRKAYYATRPFDESTLDTPLGSGPYKVGKFEVNRYIEYERVKDWWGADLPVSRGSYNFDIVRYEFYRDRDVAFEGFTAQELSVPRGVHRAHLGDALRFPGRQGRPRQARDVAGRYAVRRAGLVHQHPPRQVQGSARARGADPGLRFRMDQQDHHVRRLCAHRVAVPEFRHDGERAAVAGRTEAARAVPRPGAGRGVRRRPSCRRCPTARGRTARCCARRRSCCRRPGCVDQGRQAACCRMAKSSRSSSCSTSRRSSRITRPSSRIWPRSGIEASIAPGRCRAISRPRREISIST